MLCYLHLGGLHLYQFRNPPSVVYMIFIPRLVVLCLGLVLCYLGIILHHFVECKDLDTSFLYSRGVVFNYSAWWLWFLLKIDYWLLWPSVWLLRSLVDGLWVVLFGLACAMWTMFIQVEDACIYVFIAIHRDLCYLAHYSDLFWFLWEGAILIALFWEFLYWCFFLA